MADKVYIVMEDWNNCEDYEDVSSTSDVLCVSTDMATAQKAIEDRRKEIKSIADKLLADGEEISVDERTYYDQPCICIGNDQFVWRILEKPMNERLLKAEEVI